MAATVNTSHLIDLLRHRNRRAIAAFDITETVSPDANIKGVQTKPGNVLVTRNIAPDCIAVFFTEFMSLCDKYEDKSETT